MYQSKYLDQPAAHTQDVPAEPSSLVRRIAGDTAITAIKGAIGLPEAAVGIADIATGGKVGKALETVGYRPAEAKEILSDFYSPEQKEAFGRVAQADGFVPTLQALVDDPSVAGHSVVESLPSMIGGGAVGRGILKVAPKVAPWIAGAAGEGAVSAGQSAASIRGETDDGLLTGKQAGLAALTGVGVGLTSGVAGKLADKLGIANIETMLASGQRTAINKGVLRQIGESTLNEGVLEELPQSAWEQLLQNVALDKPWNEGLGSAAAQGMVAGGIMGAAGGGFNAFGNWRTSETVSDNQQMPVTPATTSRGEAGRAAGGAGVPPVAGSSGSAPQDMGDIPSFPTPTVARDSAPESVAANPYQQFAEQPFAQAPAQPAIAGPAVEGMLRNLQPVDVATGTKNPLASAVLAGGNPYQQFAEQPFAQAPAQPAIAGPAVEGMLRNLQPAAPSRQRQALSWAEQQLQDPATSKFERQNLTAMMKAADPEKKDLVKYWASFTNQGARGKGYVQNNKGVVSTNDAQPGKTAQITVDSNAKPKRDRSVKPDTDDLVTAIAKLGGLHQDQAVAQWGSAIKDGKKDLNLHATRTGKAGFLHVISKTGKNLDEMRNLLEQYGYLQPGSTIEDMYARIDQHLGGRPSYSNQNQQQVAEQDLSAPPEGYEDYPFDLEGINFPKKDQKRLKFLKRMLANAKSEKAQAQARKALQRYVDRSANMAATSAQNDLAEPTQAQIEAGNYKKGHVALHGLDISIENPAGSLRKGVDETGRQWQTKLAHHYGYIKGTVGKDKDHIDIFIGPQHESQKLFVVDQKNTKTGAFDEHKVMAGFATLEDARSGYLANYDKTGPQRISAITETTVDDFRQWLKGGNTSQPFSKTAPDPALAPEVKTAERDTDQRYIDDVSQRFDKKFKDAIFEIDEQEQKQNLLEGRYGIDRIPQKAERAALKGKLGAAAYVAGRSSGTDIADAGQAKAAGEAAYQVKANQAKALTAWAKEHELLIDPKEFMRQWKVDEISGAEHDVYFTQDDRVIKRYTPTFTTWSDYFNRVAIHNYFFPDTAYDLKGFMLDNGKLYAVVDQQLIMQDKLKPVTDQEIFDDMQRMGFDHRPSKGMSGTDARSQDFYHPDGVVMTDLHDANVFRAYDGTLAYIDAIIWMDYATKYQRLAERYGIDQAADIEVEVDLPGATRDKAKHKAFLQRILKGAKSDKARSKIQQALEKIETRSKVYPATIDDEINSMSLDDMAALFSQAAAEAVAPAPVRNRAKMQEALRKKLARQLAKSRDAREQKRLQQSLEKLKAVQAKLKAENQPAEQTGRPEKDNGAESYFKKGDRVQFANGVHGEVVSVDSYTMRSAMIGFDRGGMYTHNQKDERNHMYRVRKDNGVEVSGYFAEMFLETDPAPEVVPAPVWGKIAVDPDDLLIRIGNSKKRSENSRAAAGRAKKAESIKKHNSDADVEFKAALDMQAAYDTWAEKYPEEAAKYAPAVKPAASPAPAAAGTGIEGLKVTFNAAQNGIELRFTGKPDADTLAKIKANGFRWAMGKKIWYAKDTPARRTFVEGLQGKEQVKAEVKAEKPLTNLDAMRAAGAAAFAAGKTRIPVDPFNPSIEMTPGMKEAWLKGWDEANLAAPSKPKQNVSYADFMNKVDDRLRNSVSLKNAAINNERQNYEIEYMSQYKGAVAGVLMELLQKGYNVAEAHGAAVKNTKDMLAKKMDWLRDELRNSNEPSTRSAADILGAAAKSGVKGADEALKGLYELFGGKSLKSFPGAVDEDTYRAAKPHFTAALENFRAAGKSLKEFFSFLIDQFGAGIQPYVMKYMQEKQQESGILEVTNQEAANNDNTTDGGTGQGSLESGVTGTVSGTAGERPAEQGSGSISGTDHEGNGNTDEGGHVRSGSMASQPESVHLQPGKGSEGSAVLPSGTAGTTGSVSTPSEPRTPKLTGDNPGNYRITAADDLGGGTRGDKINNNLAAIRLVKQLDKEGRYPTRAEQSILAKYVGWGGLKSVFDPNSTKPQDQKARTELEQLLTEAEYFEARQSVLNAHYTSPEIIGSIYSILQHMGFKGGNVLEPTYGSGNFIGLMPEQMAAASKWYGSELDPVTSKIGKFLYPDAQLLESGFQDAEFPYGKFDLAIGNPPFGSEQITDTNKKRAEIDRFKIHNYVIAKSGMHLRPGGVMAMVVTSRFMDTANPEARDYLAKQFKFLTAIRLPNDAFAKNAGTEVTTDLVFFQKLMPGESAEDQKRSWLETAATMTNAAGEEITLNKWFAMNPELMLGEPSMQGTMYGGHWKQEGGKGEFTLNARPGQDTAAELQKLLASDFTFDVLKDTFTPTPAKAEAAATSIQMNREDIGIGGYVEENGNIFMREDDDQYGNPVFTKLTADTPWTEKQTLGETRLNRIKGMLDLRKAAYALIEAERFDLSDMEAKRKELNQLYDAFVSKHGFLSDSANASLMADDVKIESGLEVNYRKAITAAKAKTLGIKAQPAKADKAAIMKQRVFFPVKEITSAANSRDGYGISLSEKGRLDLDYIAGLTGQTTDEVIKELADEGLIFKDPATGTWKQEDEYLSGNVKAKLQKVLGHEGFEKNVEALTAVLPKDVTPEEIFADLGATWIPAEVYKEFADLMGVTNANVLIIPETGTVKIISGGHVQNDMNVMLQNPDHDVASLINHIAAKQAVVAYDYVDDGNGGSKRVVNKDRTKALVPMVKRVSATFRDWLMADPRRATELTKIYNDTMNTHAPRMFNGKHLKTVGASPAVRLRNSQRNAAWRMLQSPVVLLDHVVGAGKTFTIITGVMERKRLGLSNKSMIVVPNHLVGQWGADFLKLYPGARILATTEKDFAKANRKRLFARIATGNYDAVIVGHSSFGFIPLEAETQREFVMEEISYLERALHMAELSKDKRLIRNLTEKIAKKRERIKSLMNKERDDVVTFENMGVDNLVVDESHEFKNLEYSISMQNITGMGNPAGAKKSFDLYAKIQYLRGKDGAITFATGTPISNSLVEMYTILRYLNRQGLKDRNLDVFDSWAKAYASIESRIEYTPSQKLKDRQVMATFNNLPELLQLYSEFADVIGMKDLKRIYAEQIKESNKETGANEREEFPVPKVKNGARYLDVADPTTAQRQYMDYLVARANRLEKLGGQNDPKTDNHLWLMNDARKMALDIRLVDPSAPSDPDNKVNRAANNIKRIYDQWQADKGTQLVFCDLSTPAGSSKSDAAKFIKSGMTVLGLEKDKALANTLNQLSYSEQWTYLKNRIERRIESLSESATVTDADEELREKLEKYLEEVDDNDIAALQTVDTGFSVYDDLKATLINMGIPASEIRFIHEANTNPQKQELFNMVNSGLVRVLIGSSRKMGAGTNAQERLVGLHHMDAPWRPSDVEQREGRIIRQGNMLYERDPDNFEVEIPAYSTRNTFDSVSWQILARKAEMLEDFRSGARSMQDSESDAASYSEFMAESTGNPIFREKFKLEREIEELESTERNIMARRAAGERIIRNADADIAKAEKTLQAALRDMAEVKDAKIFEVDGKKYADDLTEAYTKAYAEYEAAYKEYSSKLLPEYVAARAEIEHQDLSDKEQKEALKLIKKPVEPAKPTLPRLEKTSQAARAALRVSELLDDVAERGEVEFAFGGSQVVIEKVPVGAEYFNFKTFINGKERWGLSANGLKHMSQQKLMELFNTGEIASRVAADLRVARAAVESVKQSIEDAERTLSKLKFEDADKLKAMQERYKAVVEEVNQLEKDLDKKREQEANQYISADGKRFGIDSIVKDVLRGGQFSLASIATTGLNAAELQQAFADNPLSSKIKVVQHVSELPDGGPQSQLRRVEGQYKNGTIWLVADSLDSVERARIVALGHELAHAGQSERLTDIAVRWFRDAAAKADNGSRFQQKALKILREEAMKRGYNLTKEADYRKAVKEATAVMAEAAYRTGETAGLLTRLLMHVKHFLRNTLGLKRVAFTDSEVLIAVSEMMRLGRKNLLGGKGPDGGQFALKKNAIANMESGVVVAFNNALELLRSGSITQHFIFNLGRPSTILLATGVTDLPIRMRQEVVKKVTGLDGKGKHDLPIELLYNLPRHINNPVAVFSSDTQVDSKTLLLQFRHNGNPVMAALQLEVKQGNIEVNNIASVYERNEGEYVNWVHKGRLESLDKLKGQWLLKRLRAAIAPEMSGSLTPNKILYHVAEPVKSGVREDVDGANVQYSLASSVSSALSDLDVKDVLNSAREGWKQTLNPFDWSRAARWFDDWTPESFKAAIGWLLAVPHFQAERDPAKRPFVGAAEAREIDRMDLMLQFLGYQPGQKDERSTREQVKDFLTKWQSGLFQTDWEKFNQRRADLSADQRVALDALFVEGDVSGASYGSLDKALTNPRIARHKPDARTFALYREVRDHIDGHVAKIREQRIVAMMREAGLEEGYIQQHISDYRNELRRVGGWMTRNHGEGDQAAQVYHIVKDLKFELREVSGNRQQAYLPYFPGNAALALIEQHAKEAGASVKTTARGAVIVTGDSLAGFMDQVDGIISKIGPQRVMVFTRYHQTKGAAQNTAETVRKDMKAAMPHNYREAEQYEVVVRQVDVLNEAMFQNMKNDMAVEALLEQSAQRALKRGEMTRDQYEEFRQDLVQNTAEVLLGRAAGRYQIRRAPYLIEGYETDNALSLYQDYMMGVAGMMSKAEYARQQFDHYRNAAVSVKQWAAPFIFDSLRNQGLGDRVSGNLRAFASLWYMGLRPASALINATQNYTLGVAELGRHVKGSPLMRIARANADIVKGKLSSDEEQIFETAIYRQQEMGSALAEITGHNEGSTGKASKLLHNLTSKALAMFQSVEVMNRKTMILAAYRAFRDKDMRAGLLDQAALDRAMEVNNSVNFNMHRGNLPGFARTPVGHTLYALQSFTFNSFNWIYNRLSSGEKRDMIALLRYSGAFLALGGMAALAGGDELDRLYRKLFGRSPKLDFQQYTKKHLKQYGTLGELVDAFAWHGLGGVAGVNISNSIRLQIPVVSQVLAGETAPDAIGGVFTGLIQKAGTATRAAGKGDWYRATEAAAPEAVAGAMRAYRQATRGVTTMGGKAVLDEYGQPLKYSTGDAVLRTAGFQPLEQSRRAEVTRAARDVAAEWRDNRQNVIDAIRLADTPDERRKTLKLVQEFNTELRGSQAAGLVQPITIESIKAAVSQRRSKADKNKAAVLRNYLQ